MDKGLSEILTLCQVVCLRLFSYKRLDVYTRQRKISRSFEKAKRTCTVYPFKCVHV